jgi:hypothetical protein
MKFGMMRIFFLNFIPFLVIKKNQTDEMPKACESW